MGCWTGYVVREANGELRSAFEKWGAYQAPGRRELDALVAHVRDIAGPVEWDPWLCRGLYVDLPAREIRFYGCALQMEQPRARWIGEAVARFHEALGNAYRVSYAWEGRHELARLAGAPCVPEIDPNDRRDAIERLLVVSRKVEGLRWDPVARTLHHPMFAITEVATWVSILTEDGQVHDVGLDAFPALPHLLASGPEVLTRLQAEIPTPFGLSPPEEHAIFDLRARRVSLWSSEPCVAHPGWEDWSFERLVTDIDDHLARTGRRLDDDDLLVAGAPSDLRSVRYVPINDG